MKISAHNGLVQLDQRSESVSLEHDQLVHASNNMREELFRDVVKILDDVIQFKLYVQNGLEGLDSDAQTALEDISTLKGAH